MNLKQIENEYAVSKGFADWKDLIQNTFDWFVLENLDIHIREVVILAQKECLKRASDAIDYKIGSAIHRYVTESITNESNILK